MSRAPGIWDNKEDFLAEALRELLAESGKTTYVGRHRA